MRISDWSSDVCSSDLLALDGMDVEGWAAVALKQIIAWIGMSLRYLQSPGRENVGSSIGQATTRASAKAIAQNNLRRRQTALAGSWRNTVDVQTSEEHTTELQSIMRS